MREFNEFIHRCSHTDGFKHWSEKKILQITVQYEYYRWSENENTTVIDY